MIRRSAFWAAMLSLSACAADQLRLERAGEVSTQARAVAGAATAYTAGVQARRREANIALVASDPSCSWGDTITTDIGWRPGKGFCDVAGVPRDRRLSISLKTIDDDALKSIATAAAGIAAYQSALADVLDNRPADARESLNDAFATLSTAVADLNRITGGGLGGLGPLTGDSAKAAVDLVGTLIALQQTHLKVKEVRAVTAGADPAPLLTSLSGGVAGLDRLQDANSSGQLLLALQAAYLKEKDKADFAARRDWVRQIATAASDDRAVRAARLRVLGKAIDELRETDRSLRDALAGNFSAEDRRRIALLNRRQLFSILSQVAAIFPPV